MKSIINILYSSFFVLTFAQPTTIKKEQIPVDSTKKEIIQKIEQTSKGIEELQELKKINDKELEEVDKIEREKSSLIKTISSKIDKLTKKSIKKEIVNRTKIIFKNQPNDSFDFSRGRIDSICVESKREFLLSKRTCSQWEYYKIVYNKNKDSLIIKIK